MTTMKDKIINLNVGEYADLFKNYKKSLSEKNLINKEKDLNVNDLCASFEEAVTDVLVENVLRAVDELNVSKVAIAGGVSANSYIRNEILKLENEGIKIYMPELKLCTDNAAMIASAGYYNFINGKRDLLDLNAIPNLKL